MISCTEFIPAYSVLFEFLEEGGGKEAVLAYWHYISDRYVRPALEPLIAAKGVEGCYEYWSRALNEEAADFRLTYDTQARRMIVDMRRCPSKGKLIDLPHLQPYRDYCGHCHVIYRRVLNDHGIRETRDHRQVDQAKCYRVYEEMGEKGAEAHE